MMKVNKPFIQRWVKALRSGKYKQGHNSLRYKHHDGVDRFCCLGVACHISNKVSQSSYNSVDGVYEYDWCDGILPTKFRKWIGIPRAFETKLIHLNDEDYASFEQIASFIEKELL